jgi:hypothetical protein
MPHCGQNLASGTKTLRQEAQTAKAVELYPVALHRAV